MAGEESLADALTAIGHPGLSSSRRPVLRGASATLLTLATLDATGAPTWHGLWIDAKGFRALGAPVPPSTLVGTSTAPATVALISLVQEANRAYVQRLEAIGGRLDALEGKPDPAPLSELGAMLHALAGARKHIVRLEILVAELEGELGRQFPGVDSYVATARSEVDHLDELSSGLAQAVRDLVAIRNAVEANRLAAAANRIGEASNRIAALANTSNLRMLGVAYIALAIALVSVVVLIPNTAATILGMPSAGWVPGLWVDVILVVLAVVPLAVVFSRPWVRHTLGALAVSERRSAEGIADLPEVPPEDAGRDELLIRPAR